MTISPLREILTEVDEGCNATTTRAVFSEAAVVHVRKYSRLGHLLEPIPDGPPVVDVEATKPYHVSARKIRERPYKLDVLEGLCDLLLGLHNGGYKLISLPGLAAWESSPLIVDGPEDTEIARELDLSSIPNGGVQVLGRPVSIDIGEEV